MKSTHPQLKQAAFLLGAFICFATAVSGEIGQWDFNTGSLAKTAGTDLDDLQYWDGAGGETEQATAFGTTAAFGIPNINGTDAAVMSFPTNSNAMGYLMPTPSTANGLNEAFNVNSFTLILDLLYTGAAANEWRGLLQTDSGNGSDADLFIHASGGIGISGNYAGKLLSNTWHRVGIVFDHTNGALRKYIDGKPVGSQTYTGQDGRFSLPPASFVLLFADNDGETAPGYVNSIQLRDRALTASEVIALGGPSAAGIPITIPSIDLSVTVAPTNQTDVAGMAGSYFTATAVGPGTFTYQWYRNGSLLPGQTNDQLQLSNLTSSDAGSYTVVVNNGGASVTNSPATVLTVHPTPSAFITGQWDFDQGDLRASYGQPLQYFDALVQTDTSFGTTTEFGISDIADQPAKVMCWSTLGPSTGGFLMTHGIAPNGGGTNVNQYTVIMDLLYPSSSGGYRALWQTGTDNTNDAEIFLNSSGGLGISQSYGGTLAPDTWHRVVLAFDLTQRELGKYIDGTNVVTAPVGAVPFGLHAAQYLSTSTNPADGGGVDMRWSLGPTALLMADNDNEVNLVYVSSVQLRNGRMTDAAIAAMGGPTAHKIPGCIKAIRSGGQVVIDWTGTVLESASSVTGAWSEVAGAAHPHVATALAGRQFFRVRP